MKMFPLPVRYCALAAAIVSGIAISGLAPERVAAADATPPAAAGPARQNDLSRLSAADRTILKALQQPTQLRFKRERLTDVAVTLGRQHGIRIQLDQRALCAVGILPDDCPMTRTTGDISLHSALRLLLDDLDFTCVVNRGVLLITTMEQSRRLLRQDAIAPAAYWKSSETAVAAKQKIADELRRPINLECFRTPWSGALDSLKKKARVEIQLDQKALDHAGVESLVPRITFDLKDVPFATALGQLVRKVGLTYVVDDDFILITTLKKAKP